MDRPFQKLGSRLLTRNDESCAHYKHRDSYLMERVKKWKVNRSTPPFCSKPAKSKEMPKKKAKRPSKKKSDSSSKNVTERTSPVPQDFGTVTPYLVVNGAAQAIEFYKNAFGAKEMSKSPIPSGKILNAILKIGDSMLMLSDEFPTHRQGHHLRSAQPRSRYTSIQRMWTSSGSRHSPPVQGWLCRLTISSGASDTVK